jgi:MFS family permease
MSTSAQAEGARPTRAQTITVLAGASILMSLGMSMRQSLGLFMVPITRDLSLSVSDYTLALAIQNIVWGITQPFIGAVADRLGVRPLMIGGTLCFCIGIAITIFATGSLTLILGADIFIGLALSCTASNLSLSATARIVPAASRSTMLGVVAARAA